MGRFRVGCRLKPDDLLGLAVIVEARPANTPADATSRLRMGFASSYRDALSLRARFAAELAAELRSQGHTLSGESE